MAAQPAGKAFLADPNKHLSPDARPPRNLAAEPTSPPTAAAEQSGTAGAAAETQPVGEAASSAGATAEDGYAETTQRFSKLNVDAAVFSPQSTPSVWNVSAAEFCPQPTAQATGGSGEPQSEYYHHPYSEPATAEELPGDADEKDGEVMLRTQETLNELERAPARFDYLVNMLILDIYPLVGASEQALQILTDNIVDYAESSPNVSYTCAQLCAYLNGSGIGGGPDAFWRCLLSKCMGTSKKLRSVHGSAKRRWFTTFLAELFVAIQIPLDGGSGAGNDFIRSAALAKGVKSMLMALLVISGAEEQQPVDDDLKCVAQVLKLCGWELSCFERDNLPSSSATSLSSGSTTSVSSSVSAASSSSSSTAVPPPSVSDVLRAMRSRRDRAGQSLQRLIDSVVALEASGWGRGQSATDVSAASNAMQAAAAAVPNEQQLQLQSEPVFYSYDGRQITRREAGFELEDEELQSELYESVGVAGQDFESGAGDVYDGPAAYYDDPELNDEILEAYEAFCEQTATARQDLQFQSKLS